MKKYKTDYRPKDLKDGSRLVHAGRDPAMQHGFVNPPPYRGSTVLFPDCESLKKGDAPFIYGRSETPTSRSLQQAVCELEGGELTRLTPSGLSAITCALMAVLKPGDHLLVTDNVYAPTRWFSDHALARLGVSVTYYDPMSATPEAYFQGNTKVLFLEAPGTATFEIPDIERWVDLARRHDAVTMIDNTWATPLFFKPLAHGIDISIHAATKYITGHSDAMLGVLTTNKALAQIVGETHDLLGLCAGSEETYAGHKGLRTLQVRLARHQESGLELAQWLQTQPKVSAVLHPGLPDHASHQNWRRYFSGASGLFSIQLKDANPEAICAFLDALELFGMGWSWGGYESLAVPFDLKNTRTATSNSMTGVRLHVGLEDVEDLKADLLKGLVAYDAASQAA